MEAGECLARIYTNKENVLSELDLRMKSAYEISENAPKAYEHILGII